MELLDIAGIRREDAGLMCVRLLLVIFLSSAACLAGVDIRRFDMDKPLARAGRSAPISADILNDTDGDATVTARLTLPKGVRLVRGTAETLLRFPAAEGENTVAWEIEPSSAGAFEAKLELAGTEGRVVATRSLSFTALPAMPQRKLDYIPEPKPIATDMLIGAHHCPLWEADRPEMWQNVLKHPERTPALGFYAQENPEVADWETKWAVEHGISFFVYCWYRTGQGGAVRTQFGSAIHDGLFKSKFVRHVKFTLMWENQVRGKSGVADERDLLENLLPYWIENYFKHPSYLKVDNKPVLFIYHPANLAHDLGGAARTAQALEKMRRACRAAGFDGLILLGEYRGTDRNVLAMLRSLGLDYTFAYCWHVAGNPTPQRAIEAQMDYIRRTQAHGVIPQVITVSQGWSGWRDEGSIWTLPPTEFETLLRQAKDFAQALPREQLGSRMMLLDNWNEWGEGHFIAPYRQYGFGYLDAVRRVFSNAPAEHEDLIPEDIGRGPYDSAIRSHFARAVELRRSMTRRMVWPGAPEGLAAWWTFDEEGPVALDLSGNRLGGELHKARRAPGIDGSALLCDGGAVIIPNSAKLSALKTLSIECRIRTDIARQDNRWILNRVAGGRPSTGFRLGLLKGKPCFEVPLTDWSHHLSAPEDLPTGRWVHLAATFDGRTMRLYVDGVEKAAMDRPGDIRPNDAPLILGNYEPGHAANFSGLLDDVRLYRRVLTADEIRVHAAAPR